MLFLFHKLWLNDDGQDIAEYAVMLAIILVLVVGTVRLIWKRCEQRFFVSGEFAPVGFRQAGNPRLRHEAWEPLNNAAHCWGSIPDSSSSVPEFASASARGIAR